MKEKIETNSPRRSVGNHMYYGMTRSVCSTCRQLVNAQLLIKDNNLVMRKFCPEHGHTEALIVNDADWAFNAQSAIKPPDIPLELASETKEGCPNDCGLCQDHQQHTCLAQIEVTNACDLKCPICYAGGETGKRWFLSPDKFESMLDAAIKRENGLGQLGITGGEPTQHPHILEMIRAAKKRDITGVMLFTNGLRIARDEAFVRELAALKPTIYFSFDGFKPDVYVKARGRDLLAQKLKTLEYLEKYNISTVLVPAVMNGVNDDQLGPIVDYMFRTRNIICVQVQPVWMLGSCEEMNLDPMGRLTLTGVMEKIETQTEGLIKKSDFMYIPCHNPICGTTNYIMMDDDNQPHPLKRFVDTDQYLDYITNRPRVDVSDMFTLSRQAVEGIASASAVAGQDNGIVEEYTKQLLNSSNCCGLESNYKFHKKMKQISIHAFMDQHTWDQNRAQKCCVHTLLPDGQSIPFCNYNTFHRNTDSKLTYEYQLRSQQELPTVNKAGTEHAI